MQTVIPGARRERTEFALLNFDHWPSATAHSPKCPLPHVGCVHSVHGSCMPVPPRACAMRWRSKAYADGYSEGGIRAQTTHITFLCKGHKSVATQNKTKKVLISCSDLRIISQIHRIEYWVSREKAEIMKTLMLWPPLLMTVPDEVPSIPEMLV